MTRTREPGYPSTQSGQSSSSRAPSSHEDDLADCEPAYGKRTGSAPRQCDARDDGERNYGRHRYGYDEDGEDGDDDDDDDSPPIEPDRGSDRDYRDDEAIAPDTDLEDVFDVDDLKQIDGPDA